MSGILEQVLERLDRIEAHLQQQHVVVEDDAWLTVAEAAEYLKMTKQALYSAISRGAYDGVFEKTPTGRWRAKRSKLDGWVGSAS